MRRPSFSHTFKTINLPVFVLITAMLYRTSRARKGRPASSFFLPSHLKTKKRKSKEKRSLPHSPDDHIYLLHSPSHTHSPLCYITGRASSELVSEEGNNTVPQPPSQNDSRFRRDVNGRVKSFICFFRSFLSTRLWYHPLHTSLLIDDNG